MIDVNIELDIRAKIVLELIKSPKNTYAFSESGRDAENMPIVINRIANQIADNLIEKTCQGRLK